jgi:hypothetical protein
MSDGNERGIEKAIEEAMQRGEFDDLAGKGKPLDLSGYFDAPEEQRVAHMLLRNAGIQPQEIELLNRIAVLEKEISACQDESRRKKILREIERQRLSFRLLVERARKR